ncbi:DNA primase [Cryobacterium sp. TMT1-21]|uniref:DNA primase n=1 Tax=unclassified Cryobacterium TaxID=2649013 RepID=UPI001068ED3D|nr:MULTISPECIES: DNA primase [unclassified Cryobacterium]TFC86864.1 DNA primase [Cryobacterium sp. TmT2-59]TFD13963.1 DNA primase [Cryobacterium sp. TMT4-10]TFD13978.1 DNA primase [Cryobacterium sp. TMT1-21]TFD20536.1 DNA primase [Cryobacterium sp. TMT2-23]TFD42820.1 DNA primase [Cryobacterium sp. TMT2-10]
MAGLIRQDDIEEVKARTNIADIVSDYVSLKSAGVGSMKGLCPFHDERSPSFHVRPQVGFYHCFGCGESGDVYSFLQKMDHVSFSEAVERLAGRVGIELHYEGGAGEAPDHTNRARLYAANQAAADFFVERLGSAGAAVGRTFLGERGFDALAAARFGVGFAPKSWDELTNHLRAKGFTTEELTLSGLVSSREGASGVYDRFRGRLVWPIRDITGQTIGFGARKLLDDDKGPKYLNTPETPIYHKAQVLYGLDLAKRDISRGHQVVVVEGYTDVMACHLAGVTTAVATCGTSFGVDHIKVLRRVLGDDSGVGEVVFTFDPDAAGQKAAMRAFSEEQRFTAQTFVAVGPEGLDPCDLRLHRGDDAVRRLIDSKKPMFEFMIRQLLGQYNLDTVEGRVAALRSAAPIVSDIRDPALRPGYTHELARMLGMELGEVGKAVSAALTRSRSSGSGEDTARHAGRDDAPREQPFSMVDLATDPVTRLERDGLMAMLQRPTVVGLELLQRAVQTTFSNQSLAVVRDAIAASLTHHAASDWLDRVVTEVPAPLENLVKDLAMASLPERSEGAVARYVRDVTVALVDRDLLRQKAELLGRLQRADASNREVYVAIQRELVRVEAEKRNLREE